MSDTVDEFEQHRRQMFGIAYRMLGSAAEAEDVVQEAFLRWQAAPKDEIRSARAWLSTVVTRLCLDHVKSARAKRESYVGPWLPEPVRTDGEVDAESISLAFLVLLESLTPVERAVYLLHEVFDYTHAEVAEIVGKTEDACRQILHRARAAARERRPRFAPSKQDHQRMLEGFSIACARGDVTALQRILADEVVAWSDGGGKAFAARRPVHGVEAVARLFVGLFTKNAAGATAEIAEINGWPSLVVRSRGTLASIITIETDGERIYAVRSIVNPDKLTAVS